jgi:hypothetical protein
MTRIAAPTKESIDNLGSIQITNKAWLTWFQKISEYVDSGTPGPQGEKGDIGLTPTIQVGVVEAVDQGAEYITNVGTAFAAIFNFGVPKGDQGEQGERGEVGPTGSGGSDFLIMQVFGG